MRKTQEQLLADLEKAIQVSDSFLTMARAEIHFENFNDARSELSDASNAIDDAMGLIDELMKPEPTESERTGD